MGGTAIRPKHHAPANPSRRAEPLSMSFEMTNGFDEPQAVAIDPAHLSRIRGEGAEQ